MPLITLGLGCFAEKFTPYPRVKILALTSGTNGLPLTMLILIVLIAGYPGEAATIYWIGFVTAVTAVPNRVV